MAKKNNKKSLVKITVIVGIIVLVVLLLNILGVFDSISIENIQGLKDWISGFGILGPIVYILLYTSVCLFFLPRVPVTVLAGISFGPVMGAVYALIGSITGASTAFLIARYAARDMVEGWAEDNEQFQKIDEGVEKQGWKMLIVTRLVPIFPFCLQNFAYGLSKMKFQTYILISSVFMIPGTVTLTFMSGAVVNGEEIEESLIYFGLGVVLLVVLVLISRWIQKRNSDN